MRFSFSYNKGKVLQALRYHFIAQFEIRILFIVIILFDIISAVFYFSGKIRPDSPGAARPAVQRPISEASIRSMGRPAPDCQP